MAFDPTLPVNSSQVSSSELRNQFTGLKSLIDALPTNDTVMDLIDQNSAALPSGVATLVQTVTNPPTVAQVTAIQNKLNELIMALNARP